jgi:hypothetical protein
MYGRSAFHFHNVRARREPEGIKIEPFKFHLALVAYPYVKMRRRRRRLSISALLLLSRAANVSGFFSEKIIDDGKHSSKPWPHASHLCGFFQLVRACRPRLYRGIGRGAGRSLWSLRAGLPFVPGFVDGIRNARWAAQPAIGYFGQHPAGRIKQDMTLA